MNIGDLIQYETQRGTLESSGVHADCDPGDVVYHHEWAKNTATGSIVCVMLAGFGKYYLHDFDSKTLVVMKPPIMPIYNIEILET